MTVVKYVLLGIMGILFFYLICRFGSAAVFRSFFEQKRENEENERKRIWKDS